MNRILVTVLIVFFFSACSVVQQKPNIKSNMEEYCIKTEGSIIKKIFYSGISVYLRSDLNSFCEQHYEPWGYDYRTDKLNRNNR